MNREKVVVAEILRTRGLKGEVVARSQTDIPGRLEQLSDAHADLVNGPTVAVKLVAVWQHKEHWVLKFAGVDSIEAAERFRGADLWVPHSERANLLGGDFYQSDLIGCELFDTATGKTVGIVDRLEQFGGGTPLLEVQVGDRPCLIPFVPSLCEVDLAARVIRTALPGGLLDL